MANSSITVKSIDISWNHRELNRINNNVMRNLFKMAFQIGNQARAYAPVVTGALRNSIRIETNGNEIWIIAGGESAHGTMPGTGKPITRFVDYAAKVEKHSSSPHYMQRAQERIMSGDWVAKYFKGATT